MPERSYLLFRRFCSKLSRSTSKSYFCYFTDSVLNKSLLLRSPQNRPVSVVMHRISDRTSHSHQPACRYRNGTYKESSRDSHNGIIDPASRRWASLRILPANFFIIQYRQPERCTILLS
ncbi:unnamed protein product, partial [Nesidiocoris tenuis]